MLNWSRAWPDCGSVYTVTEPESIKKAETSCLHAHYINKIYNMATVASCRVVFRGGRTGGAIAPPKIQVEEHCSPYILRVRLNTEQRKSSIDIAVVLCTKC